MKTQAVNTEFLFRINCMEQEELEELIVAHLMMKFYAFDKTRKLSLVFKSLGHWPPS
jgi:hypothetical protein